MTDNVTIIAIVFIVAACAMISYQINILQHQGLQHQGHCHGNQCYECHHYYQYYHNRYDCYYYQRYYCCYFILIVAYAVIMSSKYSQMQLALRCCALFYALSGLFDIIQSQFSQYMTIIFSILFQALIHQLPNRTMR